MWLCWYTDYQNNIFTILCILAAIVKDVLDIHTAISCLLVNTWALTLLPLVTVVSTCVNTLPMQEKRRWVQSPASCL